MERRELLKQVGVAAGAAGAGVAGIVAYDALDEEDPDLQEEGEPRDEPRPEIPERYADEFGAVIAASDAGADPSGEEPINDFLAEYANGDTLLTFEPGTYSLDPIVLSGLSKFGIVGLGDERPTIVPASSNCHPAEPHVAFESVDEFILEDVDFDFGRRGLGGSIHVFADGDVAVRNVERVGDCPDQISTMRFDLRDPDAEGVVENLVSRDDRRDSQLTGVYVGKYHAGTLTFRDCEVRGFSDNGLYASSPGHPGGANGTVEVIGGTFADNNISNVRLGSTGSLARDVTVVVESPPQLDGSVNARGIRLRERGEHLVEDCEITIAGGVRESFGAVVIHSAVGSTEIRTTRLVTDADGTPGIRAIAPDDSDVEGPVVEGVSITGSAASGYAVDVDGRDGTVFRNCTIEQSGHDRGGIHLQGAADCEIVDSEITTTGVPIALNGASAAIRNTDIATPDARRTIDSLDASDEVVTP